MVTAQGLRLGVPGHEGVSAFLEGGIPGLYEVHSLSSSPAFPSPLEPCSCFIIPPPPASLPLQHSPPDPGDRGERGGSGDGEGARLWAAAQAPGASGMGFWEECPVWGLPLA